MNLVDVNYLICIVILYCFFDINLSFIDYCIFYWNCIVSDFVEDFELLFIVYNMIDYL